MKSKIAKSMSALVLAGLLGSSMPTLAQESQNSESKHVAGNVTAMLSQPCPEEVIRFARYHMEITVDNYYVSDDPAVRDRAGSSTYLGKPIRLFHKEKDGSLNSTEMYVFPVYHEAHILFTMTVFPTDTGWNLNTTNGPNGTNQGLSSLEGHTGLHVLYTGDLIPPTVEKVADGFRTSDQDIFVWLYPAAEHRNSTAFRLYNPNTGEHFYTLDKNEWRILSDQGWEREGAGWFAPLKGQAIYRVYNPNSGEHHYTGDLNEKNILVACGWKDEGLSFFSDEPNKTPVYRLFNPKATDAGSHHYTTSRTEADALIQNGWKDEGPGWYASLGGWTAKIPSASL